MSVYLCMLSFNIVVSSYHNLMLYLFAGKGLAKMKDDDIEQLFECMNEELKLINQRHQEKKKETAEKAAMTRLHTNVTKFNEAINECKRKGQRWLHKKLPIPGWTNVGLIFTHGGGVVRSFDLINRWDGKFLCLYLFNFMLHLQCMM